MPKVTLEFALPEEKEEFATCNNASEYRAALYEFANYLRNQLKYSDLTEKEQVIFEEIRDKFLITVGDLEL